jgi:hypothetical protein
MRRAHWHAAFAQATKVLKFELFERKLGTGMAAADGRYS